MGWAAIFQAIAQGITNTISTIAYIRENKNQAKEVAYQAQQQAGPHAPYADRPQSGGTDAGLRKPEKGLYPAHGGRNRCKS